jgi:LysM repeat protein
MTQESGISLPSQEPRRCPNCGMKVAAKASECLMCGASLIEKEEVEGEEEKDVRRVPGWVGSVVVVLLAAVILAGGGFGLYRMLAVGPEPAPTSPTVPPSPTVTPTATRTPTDTPVPTSTSTPVPPRAHSVQEGETMSDIAMTYHVTVDEILTLNPDVDPELIQPEQVLLIPAATPGDSGGADEPDNAASTPGPFAVHVVHSGETLISIAQEYDVAVSLIRSANDLSPEDETIRAGQSLVVPLNTPTPSPTPTVAPNATATARPPYAPPPLLYPPDGMVFAGGEAPVLLQWASVSVLQENEWYELSLLLPTGNVLSDTVRTHATAWRVPLDLLQRATGDAHRFGWRVRIVREIGEDTYQEAGNPSEVRSFVWREPTPTPTSTVTP